jgi:small subunit ribosomal protein S1
MREALSHSNEISHQEMFIPVLDRLNRILIAEHAGFTQYLADELINVRTGIRRLRVPDIDPILDAPVPALKLLRGARGNIVEALDNALEATASLQMYPQYNDLGHMRIERSAFSDALVRLDERLQVVEENLSDLRSAGGVSTVEPTEAILTDASIVSLYVEKIGIEVDAARFETKISNEVDIPSLGRAVGVMHEMGKDLSGTLDTAGERFTAEVRASGRQVVTSVNRGHRGFKTVVHWARRTWSRKEKAAHDARMKELESAFQNNEAVSGIIFKEVRSGFSVDLDGAVAFLPSSQVAIRPLHNIAPLLNQPQLFRILKLDRRRDNIVVSRRVIMEETPSQQEEMLTKDLKEGQIIDGVIKSIADYGAFVDLGGSVDGLLHVKDISWHLLKHPADVLDIGQSVKVKVIKIDRATGRISVGMKQLSEDPWQGIEAKYPVGVRVIGTISNVTDYGAFVELEPGIVGLLHISEISWTKKNAQPRTLLSPLQQIEVEVLSVNPLKRRISLSRKRVLPNPWELFLETSPPGSVIDGEVNHIVKFGIFLRVGAIDGFVHLSDFDWERPGEQLIGEYQIGDMVRAMVLDVDVEKERVSLGIKQLGEGLLIRKGSVVTCEVMEVQATGIEVRVIDSVFRAFIRRSELARDRSEQRPDRFAIGQRVDAHVIRVDYDTQRISLSIKALEIAVMQETHGATLADILRDALKRPIRGGND